VVDKSINELKQEMLNAEEAVYKHIKEFGISKDRFYIQMCNYRIKAARIYYEALIKRKKDKVMIKRHRIYRNHSFDLFIDLTGIFSIGNISENCDITPCKYGLTLITHNGDELRHKVGDDLEPAEDFRLDLIVAWQEYHDGVISDDS